MQVFKTKWFTRYARREGIADKSLREAIERAEKGIIDADLGGGLIKQRVARAGKGRSGGYRTIIAYQTHGRAVFLTGFAKSERANIDSNDLLELREIAQNWLTSNALIIRQAVTSGLLQEINDD